MCGAPLIATSSPFTRPLSPTFVARLHHHAPPPPPAQEADTESLHYKYLVALRYQV